MRAGRVITIAFCAILALSGCHNRVPVAAPPPAPPPPAPPPPDPAAVALKEADGAFRSSNYDEASRGYENYLRLNPAGGPRDQVLFRLGLSYVLRPAADWQHATSTFRQITTGYPDSPFKPPASLILSLHAQVDQLNLSTQQRDERIRQLTTELDRLKKIDAERKRP